MPFAVNVVLAQAGLAPPEITTGILVVFGLVVLALVLFVSELLPIDITAIGLLVLVVLLEPWTGISPEEGISGFASPATITVLAMFILSEGIRRTGLLQVLAKKIVSLTGGHPRKQLAALVGISGTTAGFINNTPVVAMMVPMVLDIAKATKTSPSKYLIPVSYAAMMGGMLTLIGTSTNILASDISARLIGHRISMFEFTALGALVLVSGWIYLLTLGYRLTPARIKPEEGLTEVFEIEDYLSEVVVGDDSPLVGQTVGGALSALNLDLDVVKITRDGQAFSAPIVNKQFQAGDVLVVRSSRDTLLRFIELEGLRPVAHAHIGEADFNLDHAESALVELVILSDNELVGETLRSVRFAQRYEAIVLAIRRGGGFIYDRLDEVELRGGDTLLVQASEYTIQRLRNNRSFVVAPGREIADFRYDKTPVALGIVAAVVLLAAFDVIPILIAALLGMVAMVVTGCIRPVEVYDSVDWSVIFLLAGVIPLGMALEQSGGAEYLAQLMALGAESLPSGVVLFAFYVGTSLITQVVSNNASVVLMIPVAVSVAELTGAEPFSFVLAVIFAASTAMLTPVGYQTNLMVYGPGGYRFTDFFRVGMPLQLILAAVTTLGIYLIWGV